MAHGTPLGVADNDQRYGREGAFLIEAGISSSYHIAKFFGLTSWIRERTAVFCRLSERAAHAAGLARIAGGPDARNRQGAPAGANAGRSRKSQQQRQKDRGVRAALKRVLAAAGLKTQ